MPNNHKASFNSYNFWLLLNCIHLLVFFLFTLTFRVSFVGFFFSTFLEYIISFRAEEERRLASKNICLVYLIA